MTNQSAANRITGYLSANRCVLSSLMNEVRPQAQNTYYYQVESHDNVK